MRILHVNNNVGAGGPQRAMLDLVGFQQRTGHAATVVAAPDGEWWPQVEGTAMPLAALADVRNSRLGVIRVARELHRAMGITRADVVHLHDQSIATALRLAVRCRRGVAVVEEFRSDALVEDVVVRRFVDAVIIPSGTIADSVAQHRAYEASKVMCIDDLVGGPLAQAEAVSDVYRMAIAARRRRRTKPLRVLFAPVALSLLHGCDLLLRLAGLERSLKVVGARGAWASTVVDNGPQSFYALGVLRRNMAWVIQGSGSGWRRSRGPCLRRALAIALVLRAYHPVIHFGVKRGEETLLAHAWVTVGTLRFDPDTSYEAFTWGAAA